MAYNTKKLFQQAKDAILKNNLFFIEDIVAFIPCSKATFYDHFPLDSDELNDLKAMLDDNKVKTKSAIRVKLFKSDKAAELLALYRLLATPEEHRKLNQQYLDHTTKGESINPDLTKLTDNELEFIAKMQRKSGISEA